MFWVPEGFAHGFYVTSSEAEFLYKCTDYYAPEHEFSIAWNDETLGVEWPLVDGKAPMLSGKDDKGLPFAEVGGFRDGIYETCRASELSQKEAV